MSWDDILKSRVFSTKREALEAIELWFRTKGQGNPDELLMELYRYLDSMEHD